LKGLAWWLFTLILIGVYFSNMAGFLTLEKTSLKVKSVEDLLNNENIEYGAIENSATFNFFANTTHPVYSKIWNYMKRFILKRLFNNFIYNLIF